MRHLLAAITFLIAAPILYAQGAEARNEVPAGAMALARGIIVIIYADGGITVDGKEVSRDEARTAIEEKMNARKKRPITFIVDLTAENTNWEEFESFLEEAPEGSGFIFFSGDFFVGGVK
jgi:biopolymer transport protein ExbD